MLYVRIWPCWIKGVRSRVAINSEKIIQVRRRYGAKMQSGGLKLQNNFLNNELIGLVIELFL